MSITSDKFGEAFGFQYLKDGSVCSASGFRAAGMHAGFRKNTERFDLAVVVADEPVSAAATFTQNIFCAAPVRFSQSQLQASSGNKSCGEACAIVINSGNANAATGDEGLQTCAAEAEIAADSLGCAKGDILIASTGVIGVQLPLSPFEEGLPLIAAQLKSEGCDSGKPADPRTSHAQATQGAHDAARAIMTTDTVPKECAVSFDGAPFGYADTIFTVGGMAKGAGMIMPNMATMISVITTDAPVAPQHLYTCLKAAVDESFNKVTVDSDTSTNDTCFMLASGAAVSDGDAAAQAQPFKPGTPAFDALQNATKQVCVTLARAMARDGEGATKLVDVVVRGAKDEHDADLAARTIANSPLVKTAIAGHDANWGRIAAAAGRSGATFNQEDVDISIMGIPVCKAGLALDFSEAEAEARFEEAEIEIDIDLGAGAASTAVWTCDLTHDYVTLNGDYRT